MNNMNFDKVYSEDFVIEYIMENPDEVHCVDHNEDTLLHIYSARSYENLQDFVMDLWPSVVHEPNNQGRTPIYSAIDSRNDCLVRNIIQRDPSVMYHQDNQGISPLDYEMTMFSTGAILKHMLPFVFELDLGEILKLVRYSRGAMEKCAIILEKVPALYEYRTEIGNTVAHVIVESSYKETAKSILRYVHSKRPDLFLTTNANGELPAHLAWSLDMIGVIFDLCSESLRVQDARGKTPLHHAIYSTMYNRNLDVATFSRISSTMPDVLSIQDNEGLTIAMTLVLRSDTVIMKNVVSVIVNKNPESMLLRDKQCRTFLHHCAIYKPTHWFDLAEDVVKTYPHTIFDTDKLNKSVLDYGTDDIGGYGNFSLARFIFVSQCLKYTAIPDKYWIFSGTAPSLTRSFGAILRRSYDEARRAFGFLPEKDRKKIRETLFCLNTRLHKDVVHHILSKMCDKY